MNKDDWIDESDPRLAQEKPSMWLNIACFVGAMMSLVTPVTALFAFGYAALAFFSKNNPRQKQAGVSALCGFFLVCVLFLFWMGRSAYQFQAYRTS